MYKILVYGNNSSVRMVVMKKILKVMLVMVFAITLAGCSCMQKSAKDRVEEFLDQYRNLSANVLGDLDEVVETETDLSEEQKETIQAMQEYGLTDIQDVQTLQQRLEKCISDGIFYGADQQNPEKIKRFETIKKAIPQYEELKAVYLQLRQVGLEDELYKGIDLNNINYSELLERATKILEEKAKTDEIQPDISDESVIVTGEEESIIQPSEETTAEVQEVAGGGARINGFGEIIRENNTGASAIQDSHIGADIIQRISTSKKLEQPQQIQEIQSTNMWKNRFQNWYSAIDRVSQNSKGKFLKMKADIVKAISNKIKERTNGKENHRQDEQEK